MFSLKFKFRYLQIHQKIEFRLSFDFHSKPCMIADIGETQR